MRKQISPGNQKEDEESKFDAILAAVNSLGTRLGALESKVDTLGTRFEALESKVDNIEIRLVALESKMEDNQEWVNHILQTISDCVEKIESDLSKLNKRFDGMETNQALILVTLGNITVENVNNRKERADSYQKISRCENRIDGLEKAVYFSA